MLKNFTVVKGNNLYDYVNNQIVPTIGTGECGWCGYTAPLYRALPNVPVPMHWEVCDHCLSKHFSWDKEIHDYVED